MSVGAYLFVGFCGFLAAVFVITAIVQGVRRAKMSPEQRRLQHHDSTAKATVSAAMICPHCQTKGMVRTEAITENAGILQARLIGARITGGLSMLVTGPSRKEHQTQARCGKCQATWRA